MSDVDFDPENEFKTVKVAKRVRFNQSFVHPLRDRIGVMISPIRYHEKSEHNHDRIACLCKCSMKCKTTLNATLGLF